MKFFPGDLSARPHLGILDWLNSHGGCHPNLWAGDLGGVIGFSLHLEGAPGLMPEKQNLLRGEVG